MNDVTRILSSIEQGDPQAAEQLLPLVYEELRCLAAQKLAREPSGLTLQPTALVHEAYIRLVGGGPPSGWGGRGHFFGAAAEAMRRILVERARHKGRIQHGGGLRRVDLLDVDAVAPTEDEQVLLLDEALIRLAASGRTGQTAILYRLDSRRDCAPTRPLAALHPAALGLRPCLAATGHGALQ